MRVSVAVVLLGAALLQVTAGARVPRGLVGSGYGSSSGGGSCKFWCESGGGQYHCCQTPQQTALQGGGGHLPQTSGGYGTQGFGQQSQFSGGYGSQGVNSFGNNLGHNNFAHQGNSFGSQGGYGSQATQGVRPTHTVTQIVVVRPVQGGSQGGYGSSQGISQGGFRPTHSVSQGGFGSSQGISQGGFRPTHSVSQGGYGSSQGISQGSFRPIQSVSQGGYGSSQGGSTGGFTHHAPQTNSRPQGHSSNFVSNPSIVTPLGHNDAISTVGNNQFNNADNFAFQGSNQGPSYPFDLRLKPTKS